MNNSPSDNREEEKKFIERISSSKDIKSLYTLIGCREFLHKLDGHSEVKINKQNLTVTKINEGEKATLMVEKRYPKIIAEDIVSELDQIFNTHSSQDVFNSVLYKDINVEDAVDEFINILVDIIRQADSFELREFDHMLSIEYQDGTEDSFSLGANSDPLSRQIVNKLKKELSTYYSTIVYNDENEVDIFGSTVSGSNININLMNERKSDMESIKARFFTSNKRSTRYGILLVPLFFLTISFITWMITSTISSLMYSVSGVLFSIIFLILLLRLQRPPSRSST